MPISYRNEACVAKQLILRSTTGSLRTVAKPYADVRVIRTKKQGRLL